jgi:hypothetical protein
MILAHTFKKRMHATGRLEMRSVRLERLQSFSVFLDE